ncbi:MULTISPECIES: hypothetical protein [Prochlorococcus]|uniref:hypothetical protein n=1 Tax=Prochlorococcus TaxID=1218 RepID=UPI0007B3C00E|nr:MULTISPECIES: hypothetical protein [Prochlorococcus]KZR62455.1 hypothetical protein PMIT1312_01921 [Prochlorococcus marinus str. MIT 1312]KZR81061.1 hypothetical protein PMIT1327_01510 [Prochlorococcus marinus str. MIT 1327]NMO83487.1 hypothetical protein [Prochlorococcus sp. P1344]NMP05801.1 hypothetical protein [Prochlorococcus sp. P1361]NMP13319.1 hypothetical protein [Prochlorococcus sp.P1363]
MTRSRAFNRFHRFTAKKRRLSLRAAVPNLQDDIRSGNEAVKHRKEPHQRAWQKDLMLELIDPEESY